MAVTSIPIPEPSLGSRGWLRWHPGIPRERWPLLWLRLPSLPLSPSRLLAARLCSEELTGAVNSRKRLSLGRVFGRVVPASTIVQQFIPLKQEGCFRSVMELSWGWTQGTSQLRAVLWLPFVSVRRCKGLAALLLPELGEFTLHLVVSAARGQALSCPPPSSSSSPLAVCLWGQGHLKATAGQPSPPCHTVSCPAWVPHCRQLARLSPHPTWVAGDTGLGGCVGQRDLGRAVIGLLNAGCL